MRCLCRRGCSDLSKIPPLEAPPNTLHRYGRRPRGELVPEAFPLRARHLPNYLPPSDALELEYTGWCIEADRAKEREKRVVDSAGCAQRKDGRDQRLFVSIVGEGSSIPMAIDLVVLGWTGEVFGGAWCAIYIVNCTIDILSMI